MAQDVVTKVVGATIRNICDTGVGAIAPYLFMIRNIDPIFLSGGIWVAKAIPLKSSDVIKKWASLGPYFFEGILVKERLKRVAVRLKLCKARLKTPQNSFFE